MKMSKGSGPSSKSGGMQSHLGSSPDNNPTTSKSPGTGFSDKNKPKGSNSSQHKTAAKQSGV